MGMIGKQSMTSDEQGLVEKEEWSGPSSRTAFRSPSMTENLEQAK